MKVHKGWKIKEFAAQMTKESYSVTFKGIDAVNEYAFTVFGYSADDGSSDESVPLTFHTKTEDFESSYFK